MAKSKKKMIFVLLCMVVLIFGGYKIFNKKNNNPVSTETMVSNVKNEKVSMPYINPAWEEYMQLSDEEKANIETIPEMYIYSYVPTDNIYGNYNELPSKYNSVDEYPTTLYDQGNEGLCWAYATATLIESNLKRTRNIDEQISINQIDYITASSRLYINEYNPYSLNRNIGEGIAVSDEPTYMNGLFMSGMIPVKNNRFNITANKNINLSDVANTDNLDYTITETVSFPKYENTAEYRNMMKSYIMKYGGIWVGGTVLGSSGHVVVITGWNDEGGVDWKGNTFYPEGTWIVQNSWNENEYDEYFIPYDNDDIENLIGIKKIDDKTWDNLYNFACYPDIEYQGVEIYQSDNGEGAASLKNSIANEIYKRLRDKTAISGNLYVTYNKPKFKSEKLDMITFNSASQNSVYKVSISTDGNKNNFQYDKNITTDLPGIYTVYFDDVVLNNEKFTIKIESDNGAIYTRATAYTSDIDYTEDDLEETISYVDFGGKTYNDNYKYNVITYVKDIEDGQHLSYKLYDEDKNEIENANINNAIIDNGRCTGIIEFPRNTKLYEKRFVDVIYNENVIDTIEITYNPNVYMAGMQGNGTEESPYVITNSEQLSCISNLPSAYYILNNDIDLTVNSEYRETYNKTKGWIPLKEFYGVLDGRGYSIMNLTIHNDDPVEPYNKNLIGFFEKLNGADIKNLKIVNASIVNKKDKSTTGILAGESINCNISNIMVTGNVISTSATGLLIGNMEVNKDCNTLNNITVVGDIQWNDFSGKRIGETRVGSMASQIKGRNIHLENCVIVSNLDCNYIPGTGGIIGGVCGTGSVELEDSYVFAKMQEPSATHEYYGKIVGKGYANFINDVRTYKGVIYFDDFSEAASRHSWIKTEGKNIIFVDSINEFKNTSLEDLNYDTSVWEYLPNNPYPTLKGQPYYFEKEDVTPVEPYKINKYDSDEENKTIGNIFPTTIEHYKENIALENPYTARVFKIKTENETEMEEEVTEGNIATGMITKIYLNDEVVAEYTNIVPGDVFADGKVNSRDAGMTQQYLIGMLDNLYETPQYYAMDFSRDGKVRLNDVELIKRYVVKLYEPSEEDYYGENN